MEIDREIKACASEFRAREIVAPVDTIRTIRFLFPSKKKHFNSFRKNALEEKRQRRVTGVGDAGALQPGLGDGRGEGRSSRGVPARVGRCRGRHCDEFRFLCEKEETVFFLSLFSFPFFSLSLSSHPPHSLSPSLQDKKQNEF